MRMQQFRIQNYKCIEDTGWMRVDDVTVLVGKNESGKTAILTALHKFNPVTPIPFDPLREFPRARFTRDFDKQDWPVISIVFNLPEFIRDDLAELDKSFAAFEQVVCPDITPGACLLNSAPKLSLQR